jgi:hypothetical protein
MYCCCGYRIRKMAIKSKVTAEQAIKEREELIRLLTLLNSSVNFMALRLMELAGNKVLEPDYLQRLAAVYCRLSTHFTFISASEIIFRSICCPVFNSFVSVTSNTSGLGIGVPSA